jgi:hypothetical protein
MRAMLLAFAAVIVIAVGANWALDHIGYSSADRNSGASVRLGE